MKKSKGFVSYIVLMIIALSVVGGGLYIYKTKQIDSSTLNVVNNEVENSNPQNVSATKLQNTTSSPMNSNKEPSKTFVECMGVGQQICYESEALRTLIIRKQAPKVLTSGSIKKSAYINVEVFKDGVKSPFESISDRTLLETRGNGIVLEFSSNQDAKNYFDSSFSSSTNNRTIMKIGNNMVKEIRSGVSEVNIIFYINKFIISFERVPTNIENHFIKIAEDISN